MNHVAADNFWKYVQNQIEPSVEDITRLDDSSRKHVQKLIYTNLIDRFDVMVDHLILDNCRSDFVIEAINSSLTETVNEAYLLQLLMNAENVQDAIDEKLRNAIRNTVLRKRHSQKLQFALKLFEHIEFATKKLQVQPGNGNIVFSAQKTTVNVPQSVCGYADWLYARRNAVVHGAGSSRFLENDKVQLKKLYEYKCPDTFKLKIGAITSSIKFYGCIVDILRGD